ncbi:MAG: hypothetical protein ISS15_12545 [Alphaproteobacteria bacterium]|nr:hypothetical protein [Alphaproteobacteria bacterium]MBL7098478.1 hypothetical protein [Alphaproteobacteria bacterium]
MANGNGNGAVKLAPLWLVVGGVALVLAGMTTLVAIHPLDFSPPKAAACEGEACAGHDSAPGERPETSHAAPAHPAEHHE